MIWRRLTEFKYSIFFWNKRVRVLDLDDRKGNLNQYTLESRVPIVRIEASTFAEVFSFISALQIASNNETLTKDSS